MTPFRRRPSPQFWAAKEAQWAGCAARWREIDPLGWKHEGRSLRAWFHAECREDGELPLCAYCDGPLQVTARATIDHFAPRTEFHALTLAWHNLFPACDMCNETYKGERWSCALVRPDVDPVEAWFDMDQVTGEMRPSVDVDDPRIRARVRLTIVVLRLNAPDRCKARRAVVKALTNAWKRDARTGEHDREWVKQQAREGPFRFIAKRLLDTTPPSTRDPAPSPG